MPEVGLMTVLPGYDAHKPGLHKIESVTGHSEAQSSMVRAASPTLNNDVFENGADSFGTKEEVFSETTQTGRPETTPLDTTSIPPPTRSIRIEAGGTKPPSSAAGSLSNSNTIASTPGNGQAHVSSVGSSRAKALSERFSGSEPIVGLAHRLIPRVSRCGRSFRCLGNRGGQR